MNLEGKKGNLEGTWRAVAGRLEGNGQSLQTLIQSHCTSKTALTWRVFRISIYKGMKQKGESYAYKRGH
ncbi:MAG TPA: hypothetical protein DCP92_17705 [Nitrospiraceae bacterium]|nr:hypothetical protein [Nitrospiraceae bacterium]